MPVTREFENLIIGSGESGKYLAWTLGKQGRTAVVERALIGGSCPNIACLPSKNIIHSAKVAELAGRAAEFGLTTAPVKTDMTGVRARKRKMVEALVKNHLNRYQASGAELILAEARFVAPKTVEAKTKDGVTRMTGQRVFLNVGSRAVIPDIPGLRAARPLTHVEALELDHLPAHFIVLGGGFVGLELAQAMRRFGSRVTVVERGPQVAGREDPDVAEELQRLFRDDRIDILLDTQLLAVEGLSGQEVRLRVRTPQGERTVAGSDLLAAAGRMPNTDGLGLENAGVELDSRGYIRVNERLQTTAEGVWAMGDCAGSPLFTHVAYDDFRVVRDNLAGGSRTTAGRVIPFCMFTDPELARVGLSEREAKQRSIPYRLAKLPMASVLRAITLSETRGFLKVLIGAESDEILGFTALGTQAGEVMTVVQTAMIGRLPYTALRDAILTHPTLAEGLVFLFDAVPARTKAGAG